MSEEMKKELTEEEQKQVVGRGDDSAARERAVAEYLERVEFFEKLRDEGIIDDKRCQEYIRGLGLRG